MSHHYIAEISLNVMLNHNQLTNCFCQDKRCTVGTLSFTCLKAFWTFQCMDWWHDKSLCSFSIANGVKVTSRSPFPVSITLHVCEYTVKRIQQPCLMWPYFFPPLKSQSHKTGLTTYRFLSICCVHIQNVQGRPILIIFVWPAKHSG